MQPLGIFDSGIGGLTVASAIRKALPKESLLYFGDTAHLPYGDKSPAAIKAYSTRIAEFLVARGAKAVIIACNTASAHAYQEVRSLVPEHIPVINVIEPVVNYVATLPENKTIGVIGTKATIASKAYIKGLHEINPTLIVHSLATPLLVPMIEEAYGDAEISDAIIGGYLKRRVLHGITTLILACTHYPLIEAEIGQWYERHKKQVAIVDSAWAVAEAVKSTLRDLTLESKNEALPEDHFFVSDLTLGFKRTAAKFFGDDVRLEAFKLWPEG
jgi:glutamate racemase